MSVSDPAQSFPVGGKSGSGMKLPLRGAGDHNGNAFPISSSSSSSSSSFLGESSPESLRSLSSLSGGRTDSPLDYDMFEVTTKADHGPDVVVVTKWSPEEEEEGATPDGGDDDVSAGSKQTESNDNSVSVYLDAYSSGYRQDAWNLNLSLTAKVDLSSGSSDGKRHGSSTSDSEATEIPADDDDDDDEEEEALFLSVSSDVGVQRSTMNSGVSSALDLQTKPPALLSTTSSNSPAQDVDRAPSPAAEEAERRSLDSKPNIRLPPKARLAAARTVAVKASGLEAKRVSKLDLKSVKAKPVTRVNTSPPKTPGQVLQCWSTTQVYVCLLLIWIFKLQMKSPVSLH